jgi:hypothetical protein
VSDTLGREIDRAFVEVLRGEIVNLLPVFEALGGYWDFAGFWKLVQIGVYCALPASAELSENALDPFCWDRLVQQQQQQQDEKLADLSLGLSLESPPTENPLECPLIAG